MGYYINVTNKGEQLPATGKLYALLGDGAKPIKPPTEWIPNLVCVVENYGFDAAAYAFDEKEMNAFKYPDERQKTWLIVENADVLSEYKK